jgi:hypothetical protein
LRRCSGSATFFQAIQRREQVEKLKYESDFIAPNARQIVVGEVGQIFAFDPNFSRRRPVQASHQIEKSGFTRSEGPTIETTCPFGISRLTLWSAVALRFPSKTSKRYSEQSSSTDISSALEFQSGVFPYSGQGVRD